MKSERRLPLASISWYRRGLDSLRGLKKTNISLEILDMGRMDNGRVEKDGIVPEEQMQNPLQVAQ